MGLPHTNSNLNCMAFFLLTSAKTVKQHQGINHMIMHLEWVNQVQTIHNQIYGYRICHILQLRHFTRIRKMLPTWSVDLQVQEWCTNALLLRTSSSHCLTLLGYIISQKVIWKPLVFPLSTSYLFFIIWMNR